MENKIVEFNTAKLAKEKGFSMFNKDTKCAIVDTRNYDVQRFSFYIDTTNQDVCRLYDDVIKRAVVLKKDVGTNSSEFNGLIPYYEGKVNANIHYYLAPNQSVLQKWLRDKCIDISVITDWKQGKRIYYVGFSFVNTKNEIDIWFSKDEDKNKIEYSEYEDALEVGLFESLQRVSETVA